MGGRGRGVMTPKYEADVMRFKHPSRNTLKISNKLGFYNSSASDEQLSSQRSENAPNIKYVKVISTLEPSQGSKSALTRKTKLPDKKRSAYQSAISFSKHLENGDEDEKGMKFGD